jgi:hypothetical protein
VTSIWGFERWMRLIRFGSALPLNTQYLVRRAFYLIREALVPEVGSFDTEQAGLPSRMVG